MIESKNVHFVDVSETEKNNFVHNFVHNFGDSSSQTNLIHPCQQVSLSIPNHWNEEQPHLKKIVWDYLDFFNMVSFWC